MSEFEKWCEEHKHYDDDGEAVIELEALDDYLKGKVLISKDDLTKFLERITKFLYYYRDISRSTSRHDLFQSEIIEIKKFKKGCGL